MTRREKRGNDAKQCMFGPDTTVIVGQAVRAVAIDSIGPICPRIIGLGYFFCAKSQCSDLGLIVQMIMKITSSATMFPEKLLHLHVDIMDGPRRIYHAQVWPQDPCMILSLDSEPCMVM